MRIMWGISLIVGIAVLGCTPSDPTGGIACTEIFVYGVNVTVTDADSGDPVLGATLTLTEDEFTETLIEMSDGAYAGAGERAGTYTLTVAASGFASQTIDNIVVTEDECHVIPVSRDVALTEADAGTVDVDETLLRDFTLPVPLFEPDSAWNQRADEAAVLPDSEAQILSLYRTLVGDITTLVPSEGPVYWPFIVVIYDEFTYPIARAGEGTTDVLLRDYEGGLSWPGSEFADLELIEIGGPVPVPVPAGTIRPASPQQAYSDGHLVLYNPETMIAYDFWQATTVLDEQGNSLGGGQTGTVVLEAGAVDFFDVTGSGANPDGESSARAVGPPLLAGMLLPEDVEAGSIDHALGFAIPGPRNLSSDPTEVLAADYFYPASTTETDFYSTNPNALAAGQRIRLKQTIVDEEDQVIDESGFAPISQMYLAALRNYGAYLIDAAGGLALTAEDIHTANLDLTDDEVNELIGAPAGTPLPAGQTKWQIVITKLVEDIELIPVASGPWDDYGPGLNDPATATFQTSNFEVVEPAEVPAP